MMADEIEERDPLFAIQEGALRGPVVVRPALLDAGDEFSKGEAAAPRVWLPNLHVRMQKSFERIAEESRPRPSLVSRDAIELLRRVA